ncbi:MAG: AAA family ATPase [Rubrivivax sp.]|nr:AAA family ATPase [Rubrivivax sp.]
MAHAPASLRLRLRLRLLGPAAWAADGEHWHTLPRKDAALLARLALDGRQPRTPLAAWLWPAVPLPRAHANLRQRLFRLRQAAGPLVDEGDDGLQLAAQVSCDLARDDASFDAPLLAGLTPEDDAVQEWLDDARRRWLARRADLMSGLAARHEAAGALAQALALTEQLLVLEPLLEHAWRRLMRLHFLRGDRAAAVASFERCERVLRDELGLRPSPETQALLARVETLVAPLPPVPAPALPPSLLRPPRRVGRLAEWRALGDTWQQGRAWLLVGEAGQGKSRLLADLAAAQPGVLAVAALPGDSAVPYALLLRLLRRLAAAPGATNVWPDGSARQELARLLPELGPAPAAPGLEVLLHAALQAVFVRAAQQGWTAVLVDDFQHADAASSAVLLAAACSGEALRWGLAMRPGEAALPGGLQPIVLGPLDDSAAAELIGSLGLQGLPGLQEASLTPLTSRLVHHAAGNPGFLLETLRLLLLDPQAASGASLPLPARMEAALAERLARLSAPALALLRVAAVADGDTAPELVATVLGRPLLALVDAWQEAEAAQLLRRDGRLHDALRAVVLAGLPQALQAPLHERVAFTLQQQGAPAAALARHFQAAGLHAAAGRHARQAADDALRVGRLSERLAWLDRAAQAFDAVELAAEAFEARQAAIDSHRAVHGPDAALAQADALTAAAQLPAQRVALALTRAEVALGAYRLGLARDAAAAAAREAPPGSTEALRAGLLLAAARAMLGDGAALQAELPSLLQRLQAESAPLLCAGLWSHWAVLQHAIGQPAACAQALQRQLAAAQAAGHTTLAAEAQCSLSALHAQAGDVDASLVSAHDAVALQRRMGDTQGACVTQLNEAIALVGLERLSEALGLLDQLEADAALGADIVGIVHELRAEVWWRIGQPARALAALGPVPADDAPLPRRLNHGVVTALCHQSLGEVNLTLVAWQRLLAAAEGARGVGVGLRAQALASVVLPPAAARRLLGTLVDRAAEAGQLPAQGLARLRRSAWAWRAGDLPAALQDARWLQQHAAALRHLYVPGGEWRALVGRVLLAAGMQDEARAWRQSAWQWALTEVRDRLPPGGWATWRAHPAHQPVFGPDG